ncbi:MAG: RyR domain-containing protein [Deltaproteobacteria bacterium]
MTYTPEPIDTEDIELSPDLRELVERLAENNHDHWALQRIKEGWQIGDERDDTEKEYDRISVIKTLKAIMALGYRIEKG